MKYINQVRKFYTIAEVGEILNISPRTIQAWIACGAIPFVRFGRKTVRISEDNLSEIIKNGANREYRYQVK